MNLFRELVKIPYTLAPMAGYSDAGFRALCTKYGCGLTVTEMVSAKALSLKNPVTSDLLFFSPFERIKCAQLFGNEPQVFSEVVSYDIFNDVDIIDINMGCPMPKIAGKGSGAALMLDMDLAGKIIRAVKSCGKCVTVKFRKGYDQNNINGAEFAKMCQDNGADAVAVHARTRQEMYSGAADWDYFEKVVRAVDIPVIANGDIKTKEDADGIINRSGAYGVMIGRGALGRPELFSSLTQTASGKQDAKLDVNCGALLSDSQKLSDILFHIDCLSYLPQRVVVNEMRKHLAHYLKNRPGRAKFMDALNGATDIQSLKKIIVNFFNL